MSRKSNFIVMKGDFALSCQQSTRTFFIEIISVCDGGGYEKEGNYIRSEIVWFAKDVWIWFVEYLGLLVTMDLCIGETECHFRSLTCGLTIRARLTKGPPAPPQG